jgi:hypothetical protein
MVKHASLRESHATSMMSAAIFGFTLITIIFTSLSLFASLFALPINRLQAQQISGLFRTRVTCTARVTSVFT